MLGQSIVLSKNQSVSLRKEKYPKHEKKNKLKEKSFKDHSQNHIKEENPEYGKEIQNEGEHDAFKDIIKEETKQHEMVENIIKKSNHVILKLKAVFPFDFFPNELIIDLSKVTFILKEFFGSGEMESVFIKDIADVVIDTGPLFSTLRIVDISFKEDKHIIHYLKKKDAFEARCIIEGLITANKEGLDLTKLEGKEVLKAITELSGMQRISPP